MPSTVELPVIGKVPTMWLGVAGAATAGVVGYAWWTRGLADATGDELGAAEEVYDPYGYPLQPGSTPDYRPPTTVNSNTDVNNTTGYTNNVEWFDAAVDRLTVNFGVSDVATASAALSRYLDRQTLTAAQVDMVRYVVNAIGQPPEGRPYQIRSEGPPPAAVGLPAPTGLTGAPQPTRITWSWSAVTGATGYDVELVEGVATVTERATITATTWTPTKTLRPAHSYRINVWPRNSAGQRGDKATLVTVTTAAGAGGGGALAAPQVTVVGTTRTSIHFRWNAVPGADQYDIRGIEGVNTVRYAKRIKAREFVWQGRRPNHSYRLIVNARRGNTTGPGGTAVGRTRP